MANLIPVDYDPFETTSESAAGAKLVPVDYDPFAELPEIPRIGAAGSGAVITPTSIFDLYPEHQGRGSTVTSARPEGSAGLTSATPAQENEDAKKLVAALSSVGQLPLPPDATTMAIQNQLQGQPANVPLPERRPVEPTPDVPVAPMLGAGQRAFDTLPTEQRVAGTGQVVGREATPAEQAKSILAGVTVEDLRKGAAAEEIMPSTGSKVFGEWGAQRPEIGLERKEERVQDAKIQAQKAEEAADRTRKRAPEIEAQVNAAKELKDANGVPLIDTFTALEKKRDEAYAKGDYKTGMTAQTEIRDFVQQAPKEFRLLLGGDIAAAAKDQARQASNSLTQAQLNVAKVEASQPDTQTFGRNAAETAAKTAADLTADTIVGAERVVAAPIVATTAIMGGDPTKLSKAIDRQSRDLHEKLGGDFKPDVAQLDDLGTKIVAGVTSTGVFAATGGIGRVLRISEPLAIAISGALPQAEQQWQEALRRSEDDPEITEWRKWMSFLSGLGIGSTEALPISRLFSRLEKASNGGLTRYIGLMAASGGEEGLQEGIQQILQNANSIALLKDPNVTIGKDVAQNMLIGALTGVGMSGALGAAGEGYGLIANSLAGSKTAIPKELQPIADMAKITQDLENAPAVPEKDQAALLKGAGFAVDDIADMSPAQRDFLARDAAQQGTTPIELTEDEAAMLAPQAEAPPAPPSPEAGVEAPGPEAAPAPEAPSARAQQLVEQGVAPLEAMQQAAAEPIDLAAQEEARRKEETAKRQAKRKEVEDAISNDQREINVIKETVPKANERINELSAELRRIEASEPNEFSLGARPDYAGIVAEINQIKEFVDNSDSEISRLNDRIESNKSELGGLQEPAAEAPAAKGEVARIVSRRKGSKWIISGLDANGKKVFQLDPIQQSDVARDTVYRLVGENPKASLGVHKKITPDGMASIRVQGKPEGFSTLRGFIDRIGGIAEEGGELASRNIPKNLIREGGVSHEEATRRAIDAGFFPDYVPPALKAGEESYQAPPEMIDRFRDALGQRKFDLPKSAEAAEEARKRKEADIERDRLGPWIKDIKADLKARNRKMSDDDIREAAIMLENGEADNVSDAIKIVHFQNDIELIGNDMADLDREVFSQILGDEMWDNMQSLADMRQEGELLLEPVEPLEMEGELEAQPSPDEAAIPTPREGGAAREKPAEEKAPEAVRAGVEAGRAGKPEEKVKEPSATKSDVERIQKMLDERLRPGYKVSQSARPADVGRGVLIADPVNKKPVFHLFEDIPAWIDSVIRLVPSEAKAPAVEKGAEGKPQLVIPGAEKIGEKEQLERQAAKPLRGAAEQKEPGGMFGPTVGQKDLMDLVKEQPPMPKAVVEGKKPTQEEKAQRDEENIQSDIPPQEIPPPVPDISLADAQAILRGKKIEVNKVGDKFIVSGKTFDYKSAIKKILGRYDGGSKTWSFTYDPTKNLAAEIKEDDAGTSSTRAGGEGAGTLPKSDEDRRISELRAREDARPDERIAEPGAKVSDETKQLISNGLKFGIPEEVVKDQIEDVGMAVNAFEKNKPMFLLANEAGTGKTFVLGGIIRELRNKGVKKFAYVTQNQDLITQIKKDLAPYGINDVQFVTYSKMDADVKDGILIFDEAHNVKNIGEGKGRAIDGQKMMQQAKMTIFASATPFQNPSETEYLSGTGLFDNVGGFADWAKAYGSSSRKFKFFNPKTQKEQTVTKIYWVNTAENKKNGAAARQWFMKQGIMTQRAMKIDPSMVDVTFKREKVDEKWVDLYNRVMKAYDTALNRFATEGNGSTDNKITGEIMRHRESMVKRILEASKINAAIDRAKELLKEGKYVVIFVETKADRNIGRFRRSEHFKDDKLYTFPEMETMMMEWNQEAGMARMNNEKAPPRPFAAFIYEIASAMHEAGLDTQLPSTADDILAGLGGQDKVAVYTGAVAGTTATKNKNDFMAGRKKVLIATMAKGGTGLSLHDTVGNRPTVQLNINLPWAAWQVDQVSARVARYGLKSKAMIEWMFASNIPWESQRLVPRVGARMADMGAIVKGIEIKAAEKLLGDFDFEGEMDVKQAQGEGKIQYSALTKADTKAWIDNVYNKFPDTWQNNHVMILGGTKEDPKFAMFELSPNPFKKNAVMINWLSAYPLREGIGSLAIKKLQDMAEKENITLTLHPWNKGQVSKSSLIKFYKKNGFTADKGSALMTWSPRVKVEGNTQYSAFNSSIEPLIPDVINHIRSVISRMVGDKVAVKFYDKIIMENAEAAARSGGVEGNAAGGFYDNANGIIGLALDMESGAYPFDAMYHEVFHVLEDLLTPAEINALNRDADYIKNLVLSTYDQFTPESYDRLDIKEQRAYAMGAYGYRRDRKAPIPAGPARTILNKLYNIWKAITRAIRDVLGRRTAEDIFSDVYLGNLKYRMNDTIKDMNKVAGKAYAAVSGPQLPGMAPPPPPRRPVQQQLPGLPTPQAAAMNYTIDRSKIGSDLVFKLMDKYVDLADLQTAIEQARGSPLPEGMDVYLALQLYQDRAIARQDRAWSEEIEPMIKDMQDAKVSVDDLGLAAYALHAFERNEEMQRRDPTRFAGGGGSGLTDDEAQDILDNFAIEGKLDAIKKILNDHVYPMIRRDVAMRYANGLLTQDQYNQYTRPRSQGGYDYYVPLTGYAEDESELTGKPQWVSGVGKGFPVYGKEYKTAFGRESLAQNPVYSVVNRRMEGITRAEKQRVDLRLYNLFKNNPNPEFAEIVKPGDEYVKKLGADGTVQYVSSTVDRTNPYILTLKIGGKEVYIRFNSQNENMVRLVKELKGVGENAGKLMQVTMAMGRYFSKVNTQWVLDFFLVNFPRDLQDALVNMYGTKEGLSTAMLSNVAKSAKIIAKYNTGGELTQQDKALLEEWVLAGGHLDYGGFRTAEKNVEEIKNAFRRNANVMSFTEKGIDLTKKASMGVLNAIETINDTFDSTVRFAVYLAARQNGIGKDRSAQLARRATVDFKTGGKLKPLINALYPFSGAAIAGSRGLYRLWMSKRGRRALISMILISAFNSILGSYMSDDDDVDKTKKEFWTKIKPHERTNSIIIPIKIKGRYLKIPIGFYLQPFWVFGDQLAGVTLGQISATDAAVNIATAFSNAFNPLGGGALFHNIFPVQAAGIPARGLYETWYNTDWMDRQMHPERQGVSKSSQYYDKTSDLSITLADQLNRAFGGNPFKSSIADVYPANIDYWANYITGGVGRFAAGSVKGIFDFFEGNETPLEKVPFVRRYITSNEHIEDAAYSKLKKEIDTQRATQSAAWAKSQDKTVPREERNEAKKEAKELRKELGTSLAGKKVEAPLSSLPGIFRETDKKVSAIEDKIDQIKMKSNLTPQQKKEMTKPLEDRITELKNKARRKVIEKQQKNNPSVSPLQQLQMMFQ